jgi:hypothetical protein
MPGGGRVVPRWRTQLTQTKRSTESCLSRFITTSRIRRGGRRP